MTNSQRTVTFSPTAAQWAVLDNINGVPAICLSPNETGGVIHAYEISDDSEVTEVTLYVIEPDGEYYTESLEDGLHYGWTRRNSDGEEIL